MTAIRARLPNRRLTETFNLASGNLAYTASIGRFPDGRLAEIFISNNKAGSAADTIAKDAAVICSIALQHGVPMETIRRALMRDSQGRASGPLGEALDVIAADGGGHGA
jgi:hypothetical protein